MDALASRLSMVSQLKAKEAAAIEEEVRNREAAIPKVFITFS
ncbi:hypothetical protein ACFOU2_19795 [Bacillus songklensis]|uniref:Uncharacterized protein n=1 Tax=Bacillus songklensis TaxID=1069116 RepID=A0ABV8B8C2_9BACI